MLTYLSVNAQAYKTIDVINPNQELIMLISVIIPVHNGEELLSTCLESVRSCTSDWIECIVVDDGSTDGTVEVYRKCVHGDARFRIINQENAGVSAARNRGLAEAAGDYVFFLDADDFIDIIKWPEIISHAADSSFDLIAFGYYDSFGSGKVKKELFPKGCDISKALLATTLLNACWGKLLRKEIIVKNGISFRNELETCEDAIFILEFAQKAKSYCLINSCVLYYRIHPGGVMRRKAIDNKLSDLSALYARRLEYLDANYDETLRKITYRQFFSIVTALFRECAGNRRIPDIRRAYCTYMKNAMILEIIAKTKMKDLTPFYKKFEYFLMRAGFFALLAAYFKAKAALMPDRRIRGKRMIKNGE